MVLKLRRLSAALGACFVAACSSSSGPTGPSAPVAAATGLPTTSSVSSVALSGSPPAVGGSSPFIATATFSNGTTQSVTTQATWVSSNTAVATVSSTGSLTAVGMGLTELRATYQGVS